MKKLLSILCMTLATMLSTSAQGIYDINVKNADGKDVALSDYKGKVLLIVNTATKCGFTPQYKELQALYKKYHDQGFEILDFPCNQFGAQAPGTIRQIREFCTSNYSVEFTQFDKIDVNGANASPLYSFLKSKKGFAGFKADAPLAKTLDMMLSKKDANYAKSADIKWNFTKFLISRDGRVIKRYEPTEPISEVETDLLLELNPVTSAIMGRRSIRKYLDTPVEHEKLAALARCAINAPSGMNMQPWVVRIVESQELINKATEVYKKVNAEQVKRDSNFKNMFRNAPNLICVCTPTNGSGQLDAGLLGENVMVAAHSMGLGTCCLGGPVRFLNTNADTRFFIDSLNIPAGYSLSYIIAVGYPDECPDARPRDESKVAFIK